MSYEIECPVCDRKAPANTAVCQHCGADLKMASFDDLEEIAVAIAAGKPSAARTEPKPAPPKPEPRAEPTPAKHKEEVDTAKAAPKPKEVAPEPKAESAAPPETVKEEKQEEGKHGLGRLFGKKKK